MEESEPDFEQACKEFKRFIVSCGRSPLIAWTFLEDYVWVDPWLYVSQDNLAQNEPLVASIYDLGIRGFGVELSLIALSGGRSLCTIRIPDSELDAQYRMVYGLKMSVHLRLYEARVASPLQLKAVGQRARRDQCLGPMSELFSRTVWSSTVARGS